MSNNFGVVAPGSTEAKVTTNQRTGKKTEQRPNVPGRWVYVETGDPELDTTDSPEWESGIYFTEGLPIAFRHGLDGQTDMIGDYDLVTNSPSSGDLAFVMPLRWAQNAPPMYSFPIELGVGVYGHACQVIDHDTGEVRIYWPMVATPYP